MYLENPRRQGGQGRHPIKPQYSLHITHQHSICLQIPQGLEDKLRYKQLNTHALLVPGNYRNDISYCKCNVLNRNVTQRVEILYLRFRYIMISHNVITQNTISVLFSHGYTSCWMKNECFFSKKRCICIQVGLCGNIYKTRIYTAENRKMIRIRQRKTNFKCFLWTLRLIHICNAVYLHSHCMARYIYL